MKRQIIIWLILTCGVHCCPAIIFGNAVETALQNNIKIKQYNERYEQKKIEDISSWRNFLPKITFSGSFNNMNNPLDFDLSPSEFSL